MEYPDILEKILIFLNDDDLFILMQTCRTVRNIVGKSDIWKRVSRHKFDDLPKYINIEEIFKLFVSIKLSKKTFAIQPYYGDWYYLYVMKRWFSNYFQDTWSLYSLLHASTDIEKMSKICGFISELVIAKQYHEWTYYISELSKNLDRALGLSSTSGCALSLTSGCAKGTNIDKILQSIYIDGDGYNNGEDRFVSITIINTKIKYSSIEPKMICYPIGAYDMPMDPKHFYYKVTFYYQRYFDVCSYSKNNGKICDSNSGGFLLKLHEIANELEVNPNVFREVIRIVLGKNTVQCEKKVNEFMRFREVQNTNDVDADYELNQYINNGD